MTNLGRSFLLGAMVAWCAPSTARAAMTPNEVVHKLSKRMGHAHQGAFFESTMKAAVETQAMRLQSFRHAPNLSKAVDLLIAMDKAGQQLKIAVAHDRRHGTMTNLDAWVKSAATPSPEVILGPHIVEQLRSNHVGRRLLHRATNARELIDAMAEDAR